MCGRYNLTDNPAVHVLLDELGISIGPLPTRYNIAPTESALTIFHDAEAGYQVGDMRWWLTPSWSDGPSQKYAMFNARSETIETSRAYRGPFLHHRAIIPATSFIEWQKQGAQKQPCEIRPSEGCLLFAAIWDEWTDGDTVLHSCSMVTTAAVKSFAHIHHRQPVMLSAQDAKAWLDPGQDTAALQIMMEPQLPGAVQVTPISTATNNARVKQPPEYIGEPEIIR